MKNQRIQLAYTTLTGLLMIDLALLLAGGDSLLIKHFVPSSFLVFGVLIALVAISYIVIFAANLRARQNRFAVGFLIYLLVLVVVCRFVFEDQSRRSYESAKSLVVKMLGKPSNFTMDFERGLARDTISKLTGRKAEVFTMHAQISLGVYEFLVDSKFGSAFVVQIRTQADGGYSFYILRPPQSVADSRNGNLRDFEKASETVWIGG